MNARAKLRQPLIVLLFVTVTALVGCNALKTDSDRWLSPDKVISAPGQDVNLARAIRSSVHPADLDTELVPNAESPRPKDLRYSDEDYIIAAGDIVDISILDLFSEGLETPLRRQISEKGFIDLPLLTQRIRAQDRTKEGLREAIKDAYSPEILVNPTVSVTVIAQRANTFSILGAVDRPSQYSIIRRDLRLLGALALAGGITQSNIRYIYVIRQPTPVAEKGDGGVSPDSATGNKSH